MKDIKHIKEEWNKLGEKYAVGINEMVEFGETHGWDNWKGQEPVDSRDHLVDEVFKLLKKANEEGEIEEFRNNFPPAHTPFIKFFEKKGQHIDQLHFIEDEKIVFLTGTSYQKRQAYILEGNETTEQDSSIDAIGKSKQNNVFAVLTKGKIITTQGWQGDLIESFELKDTKDLGATTIIPFNNGRKILFVSSDGIYLISKDKELLIHPEPDLEDEELESYIDMENADISYDNEYIVVGSQDSDHRILNINGEQIGFIGPQSSYPHFCLFSDDDSQLITNSCHFYNGITIGVSTDILPDLEIEAYSESDLYNVIDEEMRVYAGVASKDLYILGDAYGYIKAFDNEGKRIWRHFLGSTIGSIALSDDKKTLWIGSCTGMIHKLRLDSGHRDNHTIGNGKHYEEFRLIMWKEEPIMVW